MQDLIGFDTQAILALEEVDERMRDDLNETEDCRSRNDRDAITILALREKVALERVVGQRMPSDEQKQRSEGTERMEQHLFPILAPDRARLSYLQSFTHSLRSTQGPVHRRRLRDMRLDVRACGCKWSSTCRDGSLAHTAAA